jgi:hypothetical protein
MKSLILIFICLPAIALTQKPVPRFENDTLYTTSGFKVYPGQTIQLAKGTANDGNFRFVKYYIANSGTFTEKLHNSTITVSKLKDFNTSSLGNVYIRVIGKIVYHDGSKDKVDVTINFDRAITNFPPLPPEIIVPDEFRTKSIISISDEILKLRDLMQQGIITKEEFETAKKKLLNQ